MRAKRAEFLSAAARELNSSLDYADTLTRIAGLAVPKVADWCVIDIGDSPGNLQRLVVAHSDPAKKAMLDDLVQRYPQHADTAVGPRHVVSTGEPELVADISDAMLASMAEDETHLTLMRGLGYVSYVCVPLVARGRTLGALSCVAAESGHRYDADDLVLFEALAGHAGQAIANARLFADLEHEVAQRRQREARLARLSRQHAVQAEMIQAIVNAPDRAHLFAAVCRIAVTTGACKMSWVGLMEPAHDALRFAARYGVDAKAYLATIEPALNATDSMPGPILQAIRNGQAVICNDIAHESNSQPWRERALAHGQRALAALPLRTRGQVVGVFCLCAGEPRFFDAEGKRLFTELADNITFALDALDREQRRSEAEHSLEQERAFQAIALDNLKDGVLACDTSGAITLFNDAAREFYGRSGRAVLADNAFGSFELLEPDGVTRLTQDRYPLYRALAGETLHEVEMVIAPQHGERRVVVCNGQALYDSGGRKVGALVAMHDITARKQAETRLVRLAFYDPLTGLANRRLLLDRLGHALARGKRQSDALAVLFIDLDRLKVINDSLGHDIGDEILILIARRLREVVRGADTVARLGGDEFVVVCEDLAAQTEAIALSHRIAQAVAAPCVLQDTELALTASIGIAVARGDESADELLRNADTAMYQAKHRGKARHALFDDALRTQAVQRLQVENALRHAISEHQLRLSYQPIIDLASERIVGAEALVRYYDPERGLIMPGEFLDVAEESGLVMAMGRWVLEEACRQTRRWRDIDVDFQISINLSTRQLGDPMFANALDELLTRYRLGPGAVALEITESVLMEAANSTQRILRELKNAGPRLGIDDFGTGYSSLTYLRRFPVDFVKIDRSFVRGLGQDSEDTAIVTAVINLGKALRLTTIAEGVETAHQAAILKRLGCDRAQGFYYARPQPAGVVTQWLRAPATMPGGTEISRRTHWQ